MGLGCSAFARHYLRNHYCFLFLQVLRCFSSLGCQSCDCMVFNHAGCPIRTSTDQGLFAPPRSFSQLTTSFVVSESLGIRHTPLFASYSSTFSQSILLIKMTYTLNISKRSCIFALCNCITQFIALFLSSTPNLSMNSSVM